MGDRRLGRCAPDGRGRLLVLIGATARRQASETYSASWQTTAGISTFVSPGPWVTSVYIG